MKSRCTATLVSSSASRCKSVTCLLVVCRLPSPVSSLVLVWRQAPSADRWQEHDNLRPDSLLKRFDIAMSQMSMAVLIVNQDNIHLKLCSPVDLEQGICRKQQLTCNWFNCFCNDELLYYQPTDISQDTMLSNRFSCCCAMPHTFAGLCCWC